MKFIKKIFIAIALVLLFISIYSFVQAEVVSFDSVNAALKYVKKNKPNNLVLENVSFKPTQLLKIRKAMSESSEFHFTSTWGELTFSDDAESLDLTVREAGTTIKELEAIVKLCPNLKYVDNSHKYFPSNNEMFSIMKKYPDIHFDWQVKLGSAYHVSTKATTFSTMNHIDASTKLRSKDLELLKYCPNLKALDLGHNNVTSLDFLQYTPNLELLIIADNKVTDITPVGKLKHLQYLEIFKNHITDLSPLAECTELLDLNITWVDATDLTPLDNLPNLQRLWGNMLRKMPEEEIKRYVDSHPNVSVDFQLSHAATVDGWREHERYEHYIWCFKRHTWIPFDEPLPTR